MAKCTQKEISIILQAAEILNSNGFRDRINISQFCEDAQISRKNAYKHKKNLDRSLEDLQAQIDQLSQEKEKIIDKLAHSEKRAEQADLYWSLRNVLVALNADIKKNGEAMTAKRQKLIERYNTISSLLGLEPLNF